MSKTETRLPVVSVLMPVYNGARFLNEQIDSILAQEGVDVRLVILDDASTDNSFELARIRASRDGRITLLRGASNVGLCGSVSRLLWTVDTQYFAMSDQDDVWDPDKLSCSIVALSRPRVKLVYSDVRIIDENGSITTDSYWTSRAIRPIRGTGTNLLPVVYRNPIVGHTIVATADVATAARDLPSSLIYYEVLLAAAASRVGEVDYINDQLGSYRTHASNVVGPLERRLSARVVGRFRDSRRLRLRQRQRIAALTLLASEYTEYEKLAELYQHGLCGRVFNIYSFVHELGRSRSVLGLPLIVKESLMHLLIGPGDMRVHAR